jgi:glycosyltransferase involved in cell wall biosynthesis
MGASRRIDGKEAGAAVIATNNGVYRQAVVNRRTGLLVEHTPSAWYNALSELIANPHLRTKIQLEAHKVAWRNYNIATGASRWAAAYSEILNERT